MIPEVGAGNDKMASQEDEGKEKGDKGLFAMNLSVPRITSVIEDYSSTCVLPLVRSLVR